MATNTLAQAASPYLRSAMHQPIHWYEWGEEAFAAAQRENKPILLDIGAVWCHWCHVMDHESYDDPEVARIVNESFIAVKVDRDERPDIDSRYQAAVSRAQRTRRLAADRVSHARRQAVLRRHLLSARRPPWTSRLQARAAGHRRRLPRKARRSAPAGRHGDERAVASRVIRWAVGGGFSQDRGEHRAFGHAAVRRGARRLRHGAQVPASGDRSTW